jgi:hypothetical protein
MRSKAPTSLSCWVWPDSLDLEAGRIIAYRHKTKQGLAVPIFPQVRSLVEKLCKGKVHNERLFKHDDAAKALSNACKRLGLPAYSHRSLRRMFVVRAIEGGVDVKAIAEWQGRQRSPPQTSARGMARSHESGGLIIWRV